MSFFIRIMLLLVLVSPFLSSTRVSALDENTSNREQDIRYISDFLVINIKNNLNKPYSVTGKVFSGDKVVILEQKDDYMYVQTDDGSKGWILKQYLKKETPKPIIIEQLKEEIERLQALQASGNEQFTNDTSSENDKNCDDECLLFQQELTKAKEKIIILKKTLATKEQAITSQEGNQALTEMQQQHEKIQQELKDTSAKYKLLSKEYENRTSEIATLESAAAKKDDKTRFMWFGAGAVVFFLGILFGRTGNKKKNKYLY